MAGTSDSNYDKRQNIQQAQPYLAIYERHHVAVLSANNFIDLQTWATLTDDSHQHRFSTGCKECARVMRHEINQSLEARFINRIKHTGT